jgi:NADH:ubiquinone oxidoreductase subunit 4 (subunit M)
MLEFHDGSANYFSFRNRPPKATARGDVRMFKLPSRSSLMVSRCVNVAVVVALLVGVIGHRQRNAIAEAALVVQAIHLICKIMLVWRFERITSPSRLVSNAARVTLQSEHTGYLVSVNLIFVELLDRARPLGEAICMALLFITVAATVMSRPPSRSLPSHW